jgi:aspartyl-tRNA synthetase
MLTQALHHPFTAPHPEDIGDLKTARALAYDLVYNGVEIGGGSLRIYRREIQEKVLDAIGLTPKQAEEKFGFLLEALDLGAPPHGTFLSFFCFRDVFQLKLLSGCLHGVCQ